MEHISDKISVKIDGSLETCVYRKKTNKGLLLHYQSHVDSRYKRSLLRTMLDRAKRLSSTLDFLLQECKNLKGRFLNSSTPLSIASIIPQTQSKHQLTTLFGLRCHLKIRNRLTWFADDLVISERKLINNYSPCSQAKRSLII